MGHKRSYYIVNAITFYRLAAFPVLIYLIIAGNAELFKWMLALSFFTDAIDGLLSRYFKVTSIAGARLDSIGDDLTIAAAFAGIVVFKTAFIQQEIIWFLLLAGLYLLQLGLALVRYRRMTSFHTYSAKIAALMQAVFILALFFMEYPLYLLFYSAVGFTILNLVEEILLVLILPKWQANVKGLYWIRNKSS